MGFFDHFRDAVSGKAKAISNNIESSYRERLGEELVNKKNEIKEMEEALQLAMDDMAEKAVALSKRESELGRYYLIPKIYVKVLVVLVVFALAIYAKMLSDKMQVSTAVAGGPVLKVSASEEKNYKPSQGVVSRTPYVDKCIAKGREYYKNIGKYPELDEGVYAETVIHRSCTNSKGEGYESLQGVGRRTPSTAECIAKGRSYYKEIGSYPKFSTGEDAESEIHLRCLRSNGMSFGSVLTPGS